MPCSQPGPAATVTVPLAAPPTPGMPTVSNVTATSCTVNWTPVQGATYYKILVNNNPVAQASYPPVTLNVSEYQGQTIQISIQACN
jgi:hypothetical protein